MNLELTQEGREAAREIPAVLCGVQNDHMRGFTVEEWQTLKNMLRRILDNAEGGFITVSRAGLMSDERSRILERWFGPAEGPSS